MSGEEDIFCSKCNKGTEQALMLSCDHNLCLSCASKVLNNQQVKDFNSSQYIKCDICNSLTELDSETIKQILSGENPNYDEENGINENYIIDNVDSNYFLDLEENNNNTKNSVKNKISNNKINMNNNNKKSSGENNNNTSSEINMINDLINNNKCKEHGEILNYLCLDCMSNCICPECVVHGIHRNHEVLNIKKAYPLIYNKIQDLSKYVNDQIKEVALINETITKKKNFINTLIERCKNEIHNTFEQIRVRLDNKEKEIINNSTNVLNKSIIELNNYNNLIQKKLSTLGNLIDQINNILNKRNELNTINYFCENKNIILSQAELNELNNLTDLDTFTNIKIEPDRITLNKMLEGLNSFHFNINNINGINMNNNNQLENNINFQNIQNRNNLRLKNSNNNFNNANNNNFNNINNNMINNKNNNMINNKNNNYINQRKRIQNPNNMRNNQIINNMKQFPNNFKQNMNMNNYRINPNNQNNIMPNNFY